MKNFWKNLGRAVKRRSVLMIIIKIIVWVYRLATDYCYEFSRCIKKTTISVFKHHRNGGFLFRQMSAGTGEKLMWI